MSEITKGKDMNSGEPKYSRKEYASTSREKQGEAKDTMAVGLTHSTEEVQETGWREGVSNQAMSFKETPAISKNGTWVETRLRLITQMAKEKPELKFTSIVHILNEGHLGQCYKALKKNKASGIDGVTVEEYGVNLENNLKELVERMKALHYYPQAVKRVYIPKGEGKVRGIGIPSVEDKIVQMGVKRILEAIYEVDFSDSSYGFRPGRGCHEALKELDKTIGTKPIKAIVEVDIEKFFDNVDHKKLMECLRERISDPNFLRLIVRFLKAGIIEDGEYRETDNGTPQGGVLSPMLANIYLHYVLDLWFDRVAQRELKGYMRLIRYCDDFVVCFEEKESAEKFMEMLKERLSKYRLKIAEEKSGVIEFGREIWEVASREGRKTKTFEFLGLTHYCDKTRRGKFKVGRKTSSKKFIQKMKAMNEWLKRVRSMEKLPVWWEALKVKLIGHYHYYGISGNMRGISRYYRETTELAYKWINRRSQKKSMTYEKFSKYWKDKLPKPKIYHSFYTKTAYV
jgi:group II intron reverse transcriptase/maturase